MNESWHTHEKSHVAHGKSHVAQVYAAAGVRTAASESCHTHE